MKYNPDDDSYTYDQIAEFLFIFHKNNQKYLNDKTNMYNLNLLQSICLISIYSNKDITQQELSRSLFLTKSGITKAINDLEKNKYIKRIKSENDGRRYSLILTYKGEKVIPKLLEIFDEWEERLEFNNIDENFIKTLKKLAFKSIELNS